MNTQPLPVNVVAAAVRAWTEPVSKGTPNVKPRKAPQQKPAPLRDILVVDTETTTDPTQRLTFGTWLHARVDPGGTITRLAEGIFHADDLQTTDPKGHAALSLHCKNNLADVDLQHRDANPTLALSTRTEFVERTMWKLLWKARAHLVMFNKPFDLSRLALDAGESRGRRYGGFSLQLWRNDFYRPRVFVKHIDSKKSMTSFTTPGRKVEGFRPGETNRGAFLDLRTWAHALTGSPFTLAGACEAFGVEHAKHDVDDLGAEHGTITDAYIRYARRDTLATAELFEKLLAEHRTHPIDLEPTQAMSPASVAKSYLRSMGLQPRLDVDSTRITAQTLGRCMGAFYGGRAEVRIRHTPVPVELHDFTSMYPTVNALMGLWKLLTAETIRTITATADVAKMLAELSLDDLFNPTTWPKLVGFAEVVPDGDILPVRAAYGDGDGTTIAVNPATSTTSAWYTLADLAASTILSGRPPSIIRAFRLKGSGTLDALRAVKLRGIADIDPATDDFFVRVVELRQIAKTATKGHDPACRCDTCRGAAFLKVLANSGSYGIFSELNRADNPPTSPDRVVVHGPTGQPFDRNVPGIEAPGPWCFPPVAACITGAARLMLAMLERCVTDLGGAWAFCDTDSLAIVATHHGALVRCPGGPLLDEAGSECVQTLTFDQCASIRDRFTSLNPYNPTLVAHLLKPEARANCVAVSAKRYALYNTLTQPDGSTTVDLMPGKFSEHGLGHLLNPGDPQPAKGNKEWIADSWRWRIAKTLGLNPTDPPWFDRAALGSHTVSSPRLRRCFTAWNRDQAYPDQVKPWSFMLVAFLSALGSPWGDARLIAPYERDASRGTHMRWVALDKPDGPRYRLTTDPDQRGAVDDDGTRVVQAQTYREILTAHWRHPEPKFIGSDGNPCGTNTIGLLRRRPTIIAYTRLIGKESNDLDEAEAGLLSQDDDPITSYDDHNPLPAVWDVLHRFTPAQVESLSVDAANLIQAHEVRRYRRGTVPHTTRTEALVRIAADVARRDLDNLDLVEHGKVVDEIRGLKATTDPRAILREWVGRNPPGPVTRLCGCGCGSIVTGRARYAEASCQKRTRRLTTKTADGVRSTGREPLRTAGESAVSPTYRPEPAQPRTPQSAAERLAP